MSRPTGDPAEALPLPLDQEPVAAASGLRGDKEITAFLAEGGNVDGGERVGGLHP